MIFSVAENGTPPPLIFTNNIERHISFCGFGQLKGAFQSVRKSAMKILSLEVTSFSVTEKNHPF